MTRPRISLARQSRLLFHWRASDLSLKPLTGQVPTWARATTGGAVLDRHGLLRTPVHSAPRWEMVDLDSDGVREAPGLLLEAARTQICPNAQTPSAWTNMGAPTVTLGVADPWGGTSAILIEDTAAGAAQGRRQDVAYTGDGTKAIVIAIRAGTAGVVRAQLSDITAGVDRVTVNVTWNPGTAAPAVALGGGSGTLYAPVGCIEPGTGTLWWMVPFTADGVIAANTNRLSVAVGGGNAQLGTFYFAGANTWNADIPASWQATPNHVRNADTLTYDLDARAARPRALWLYVDLINRGTFQTFSGAVLHLGQNGVGDSSRLYLEHYQGTGRIRMFHVTPAGTVSSHPAATVAYGDRVRIFGQLFADGSVQASLSVNGNAASTTAATAAQALTPAWSLPRLTINAGGGGGGDGLALFRTIKMGVGLSSLDLAAEAF